MSFWSQICQTPSCSWPRPNWITVLLVMICSCLMYPVIRSIYFEIHSSFTGSYVPGSHSLAFVNCPNEEIAKDIARGILEKRLAAGVSIMPKTSSLYLWKGEIEESTEVLLVMKTKTAKVFELSSFVGLVHPFQMPDFLSIPIEQGSPDYLRWIEDVVTETES